MKFSLISLLFLSSCTVKPAIIPRKDGTAMIWAGGTLMTKSQNEYVSMELPDGTKIVHQTLDKDETVVPNSYIGYKTAIGLADALNVGKGIEETETTKRVVSDNSLKRAESADAVKIKTFVPPETPLP